MSGPLLKHHCGVGHLVLRSNNRFTLLRRLCVPKSTCFVEGSTVSSDGDLEEALTSTVVCPSSGSESVCSRAFSRGSTALFLPLPSNVGFLGGADTVRVSTDLCKVWTFSS